MAVSKVSRYCTAEVLQALSVYFNMHKKQSKVASGQNSSSYMYMKGSVNQKCRRTKRQLQKGITYCRWPSFKVQGSRCVRVCVCVCVFAVVSQGAPTQASMQYDDTQMVITRKLQSNVHICIRK